MATLPQLAAWVTLVLLLSALLYGAARLLEWLGRGVVPTRTLWFGALLATLALAASAPLRMPSRAAPEPLDRVTAPQTGATVAPSAPPATPWASLAAALSAGGRLLSATTARVAGTVASVVPARAQRAVPWLLMAWAATSLAVLLALLASYRRLLRRVGQGVPRELGGVAVLVTPDIGPLVAGVRAPRIVVPHWLLERPADDQALVLAHEQAHVAAHDARLLVAGTAVTVLLPWNPFSWALLARLRLAIEVDCDQRVLRRGTSAGRYGRLLIDLAAAAPRLPRLTPAFSYHTTHLERRLRTMTAPAPRFRRTRRVALLATTALVLVTACESQLPTAGEVERMDVATLEARTAVGVPGGGGGTTRYFLNGRELTESEAKALPAGQIATMIVTKGSAAVREVRITSDGDTLRAVRGIEITGDSIAMRRTGVSAGVDRRRREGGDSNPQVVIGSKGAGAAVTGAAQPLLLVDGVRQPQEALRQLKPSTIQSVEVVKGAAAVAKYGPDGQFGVIVVTTKGRK